MRSRSQKNLMWQEGKENTKISREWRAMVWEEEMEEQSQKLSTAEKKVL